ncbi:MAG: putative pyruvate format-lyase activating enzyme [Deltaproteobacteria bacterium]|nr:putative pyruvate format-lyase activating enzyme [Deltaproteobacteria bacterium]
MENCVQMILPSPTQLISAQIQKATAAGKDVFLFGNTMGGGPCSWAVERHLKTGRKVFATESAALTFHDNLEEVRKKGVQVVGRRPQGTLPIRLGDVQLSLLSKSLAPFDITLPETLAIAVQDHGFNPAGSNRRLRFQYWEKFLASGGRLRDLIYRIPPPFMTRMLAVQKDAPGAAVMDTCAAAVWGILCDRQGAKMKKEGFIALNAGNQHTFGAFIRGNRILGIFEHHTGRMNRQKIQNFIARFERKRLSNEEVFDDGGHGCAYAPAFPIRKKGWPVAVTGPRRSLVDGLGYYSAAPFGDMMLTGCFGLVAAFREKENFTTGGTEPTED